MIKLPVIEPPRVRGDCESGIRPCPWIRCRYHLLITSITRNKATLSGKCKPVHLFTYNRTLTHKLGLTVSQIEEDPAAAIALLQHTCVLDVADNPPDNFHEIDEILGIVKERSRQIFEEASYKLRNSSAFSEFRKELK